jgi:VanZ family protein
MRNRWLPVVLYIGLILSLSSIRRPPPGPDLPHSDKILHVIEYAILGMLLVRARRPQAATAGSAVVQALAVGVLVAFVDELYQRTVPGRVGSLYDGAADVTGILLGASAWAAYSERRAARRTAGGRRAPPRQRERRPS